MVGSQPIKVSKGLTFDPVPDDKYQLQVLDVEAVVQMNFSGTAEEERLKYTFVILDPDKTMTGKDPEGKEAEFEVRGRRLWVRFSKNLTTPGAPRSSNLTKFVTAVYGYELQEAELNVWQPEDVIGKQVTALVNQTPSKSDPNKIFNNIVSFSKATKQLEPWKEKGEDKVSQSVSQADTSKDSDDFIAGLEADAAKAKANATSSTSKK